MDNNLQQHGIRIAIGDFGTGSASLSYLQHFSFDILKIDRSFISELHHQPRNQVIVDSIMRLCEHLDSDLITEGVESHFELDLLEGMGRHRRIHHQPAPLAFSSGVVAMAPLNPIGSPVDRIDADFGGFQTLMKEPKGACTAPAGACSDPKPS